MFGWWKHSRRRKIMKSSVPPRLTQVVSENLWHWNVLNDAQRKRLLGLTQIFMAEKDFEGCDGLVVSDTIKATIAAAACLLLVGFDDLYCFDTARSIIVFPRPMVQRNLRKSSGVVSEGQWLSGMASHGGSVVLSWRDVRRDCADSSQVNNVVLHEFAHHVDGLDGEMEGIPPFATRELTELWRHVATHELERLRSAVQLGLPTVLDAYGAESLIELFAVATEAFFCDGHNLYQDHQKLYSLLSQLYRLDSRDWFA